MGQDFLNMRIVFLMFLILINCDTTFAKIEQSAKSIKTSNSTKVIVKNEVTDDDGVNSDLSDGDLKNMFTDSDGNVVDSGKIPSLKAIIGNWNVLTGDLDGKKVCYAVSRPFAKVGNHKESRDAYFMVIYWNRKRQGINISLGFSFKGSSKINISVDGKQFSANPYGALAIPSEGVDSDIIKNMLYGKKVLVKGDSRIFTYAVDAYSIENFKQVYAKLVEICDYM